MPKRKKKDQQPRVFEKSYTTDDGKATITVCVDEKTPQKVRNFMAAILASRGIRPASSIGVTDPYVKRVRKGLFGELGANNAAQLSVQAVRDHHANAEERIAQFAGFAVMLEPSFPVYKGKVMIPETLAIDPPGEDYFWDGKKPDEDELLPSFPAQNNTLETRLYYTVQLLTGNPDMWDNITNDLEAHGEGLIQEEEPETDEAGFPVS
jgi:hypothetical protein